MADHSRRATLHLFFLTSYTACMRPADDPSAVPQPVRTVARALDVLDVIGASKEPVTLADIAKTMDIPRSSLHDIVRTLTMRGWVDAVGDGPRYALSIKMLQLGRCYLDSSASYTSLEKVLDWVAEQIDETVHLGRLVDDRIVYIGKREPSHPIRLYSAIGRSLPANATALGKVLLARMDVDAVERLLPARLPSLTHATIATRDRLLKDLDLTRRRGYAVDEGESMDDVVCHAVALTDQEAISVSVPRWRTHSAPEQIVGMLREAGRMLQDVSLLRPA